MRKETFVAQIPHVGMKTFFANSRNVEDLQAEELAQLLNVWFDHHVPNSSPEFRFECLVRQLQAFAMLNAFA